MSENTSTSERELKITLGFVEDKIDAVVADWKEAGDYSAVEAGNYLKRYLKKMAVRTVNDQEEAGREKSDLMRMVRLTQIMKKPIFDEDDRFAIKHDTMRGAFLALRIEVLKAMREIEKNKKQFITYYVILAVIVAVISWIFA